MISFLQHKHGLRARSEDCLVTLFFKQGVSIWNMQANIRHITSSARAGLITRFFDSHGGSRKLMAYL